MLFPNVHLEFGKYHIAQVLSKCSGLFCIEDVYNCVEIWRAEYAQKVLLIISEVFKDVDISDLVFEESEEMFCEEMDSDWEDVRDDSSMHISLDTSANVSNISMAIHELDNFDYSVDDGRSTETISGLAIQASQQIQVDDI